MGYERPTPIQAQAIPSLLEGRDVVGCAQTGTGKTAAFILPTLQSLGSERGIKALVVTPTRELAIQVESVARDCAKHTHHRTAAVYGGASYGQQKARLSKRVDLLVATPGRLLDMHGRRDLDLSNVKVLVLDEADRMLDMGFWPDVKRIIDLLPTSRQSLLFSATMSRDVLRVIESTLSDPVHVEVGPKAVPVDAVDQVIYPVNSMQKNQLLVEMLRQQRDLDRVLIFARTKHRADRICKVLRRGNIKGAAIHSNRSQPQRQEALTGFKMDISQPRDLDMTARAGLERFLGREGPLGAPALQAGAALTGSQIDVPGALIEGKSPFRPLSTDEDVIGREVKAQGDYLSSLTTEVIDAQFTQLGSLAIAFANGAKDRKSVV